MRIISVEVRANHHMSFSSLRSPKWEMNDSLPYSSKRNENLRETKKIGEPIAQLSGNKNSFTNVVQSTTRIA